MIKVVYYFDKELCFCPVKNYLSKYNVNRDKKILIDIDRKIQYVANNDGKCDGNMSKPLQGYSFFEIRKRKDSNKLIRICYFCYDRKMMVLLHAFEKPDNYNTKRETNNVDKHYKKAEEYKNNFNNNSKYEEYK